MASLFVNLLIQLGPLVLFIGGMIFVYIRGTRINKELLEELESEIKKSLDDHTTEIRKVQIRQDEYEFRCKTKNKAIRIFTFHLKLSNRSFIIQWLINFVFPQKERVFIGAKLGNDVGDDDPVYRFDVVPYHRKGFIRQRHETYVEFDDIPTGSKIIDNSFMVKSESSAYVEHLVNNPEFLRLLHENEQFLEHLGIQKAKEETDPHISVTFEFNGTNDSPTSDFISMFFLVVNQHLQNHEKVKKLVAKGKRGRVRGKRRRSAKRGAGKR